MMKNLLLALLCALFLIYPARAATLGPSAAVACFDGGGGTKAWTNAGNACAVDAAFATMVTTTQTANELDLNQFGSWDGTQIPSTATINGVQIDNKGKQSSTHWSDTNLQLCNGAFTHCSSNLATSSAATYTTTNAVHVYGGASNLIGAAWVPADFDSTLELFFDITKSGSTSETFSEDGVLITVTYTTAAGVHLLGTLGAGAMAPPPPSPVRSLIKQTATLEAPALTIPLFKQAA